MSRESERFGSLYTLARPLVDDAVVDTLAILHGFDPEPE